MTLRILREAEFESAEAAAWYDDRGLGLGDEFLLELTQSLTKISGDPQSFSRLETYTGRYDVRRCVLHRFPYLIVFTCLPKETLVVAITHVRRRPLYWIDRLG